MTQGPLCVCCRKRGRPKERNGDYPPERRESLSAPRHVERRSSLGSRRLIRQPHRCKTASYQVIPFFLGFNDPVAPCDLFLRRVYPDIATTASAPRDRHFLALGPIVGEVPIFVGCLRSHPDCRTWHRSRASLRESGAGRLGRASRTPSSLSGTVAR